MSVVKAGVLKKGKSGTDEEIHVYKLKIHDTAAGDAGVWRVEVADKYGSTSTSCNLAILDDINPVQNVTAEESVVEDDGLTVQKSSDFMFMDTQSRPSKPRFTTFLKDQTVEEGFTVKFLCVVTGNPFPKVEWFKDHEPVARNKFMHTAFRSNGTAYLQLFSPVAERDSGAYRCVARNSEGMSYTEAHLFIKKHLGTAEIRDQYAISRARAKNDNLAIFNTDKSKYQKFERILLQSDQYNFDTNSTHFKRSDLYHLDPETKGTRLHSLESLGKHKKRSDFHLNEHELNSTRESNTSDTETDLYNFDEFIKNMRSDSNSHKKSRGDYKSRRNSDSFDLLYRSSSERKSFPSSKYNTQTSNYKSKSSSYDFEQSRNYRSKNSRYNSQSSDFMSPRQETSSLHKVDKSLHLDKKYQDVNTYSTSPRVSAFYNELIPGINRRAEEILRSSPVRDVKLESKRPLRRARSVSLVRDIDDGLLSKPTKSNLDFIDLETRDHQDINPGVNKSFGKKPISALKPATTVILSDTDYDLKRKAVHRSTLQRSRSMSVTREIGEQRKPLSYKKSNKSLDFMDLEVSQQDARPTYQSQFRSKKIISDDSRNVTFSSKPFEINPGLSMKARDLAKKHGRKIKVDRDLLTQTMSRYVRGSSVADDETDTKLSEGDDKKIERDTDFVDLEATQNSTKRKLELKDLERFMSDAEKSLEDIEGGESIYSSEFRKKVLSGEVVDKNYDYIMHRARKNKVDLFNFDDIRTSKNPVLKKKQSRSLSIDSDTKVTSLHHTFDKERQSLLKLGTNWLKDKELSFIEHLKSKCVLHGNSATLTCFVTGIEPFSVLWYKDGCSLSRDEEESYIIRSNGGHLSLEIPITNEGDTGNYVVDVRNEEGKIRSHCYLQVEAPHDSKMDYKHPEFEQPLQHERVLVGQPASFKCKVRGTPAPFIKWFKDGVELQRSSKIDIHHGDRGTAFLLIHDADYSDIGLYKCEAHSVAGRCRSSAKLIVLDTSEQIETLTKKLKSFADACDELSLAMEVERIISRSKKSAEEAGKVVAEVPEKSKDKVKISQKVSEEDTVEKSKKTSEILAALDDTAAALKAGKVAAELEISLSTLTAESHSKTEMSELELTLPLTKDSEITPGALTMHIPEPTSLARETTEIASKQDTISVPSTALKTESELEPPTSSLTQVESAVEKESNISSISSVLKTGSELKPGAELPPCTTSVTQVESAVEKEPNLSSISPGLKPGAELPPCTTSVTQVESAVEKEPNLSSISPGLRTGAELPPCTTSVTQVESAVEKEPNLTSVSPGLRTGAEITPSTVSVPGSEDVVVSVSGSEDVVVSVSGSEDVVVSGSEDVVVSVPGSEDVAVKEPTLTSLHTTSQMTEYSAESITPSATILTSQDITKVCQTSAAESVTPATISQQGNFVTSSSQEESLISQDSSLTLAFSSEEQDSLTVQKLSTQILSDPARGITTQNVPAHPVDASVSQEKSVETLTQVDSVTMPDSSIQPKPVLHSITLQDTAPAVELGLQSKTIPVENVTIQSDTGTMNTGMTKTVGKEEFVNSSLTISRENALETSENLGLKKTLETSEALDISSSEVSVSLEAKSQINAAKVTDSVTASLQEAKSKEQLISDKEKMTSLVVQEVSAPSEHRKTPVDASMAETVTEPKQAVVEESEIAAERVSRQAEQPESPEKAQEVQEPSAEKAVTEEMSSAAVPEQREPPPSFVENLPESKEVKDGESLILQCTVEEITSLKVVWLYNKTELVAADNVLMKESKGVNSLEIKKVNFKSHSGTYTARIVGGSKEVDCSCTVMVLSSASEVESKGLEEENIDKKDYIPVVERQMSTEQDELKLEIPPSVVYPEVCEELQSDANKMHIPTVSPTGVHCHSSPLDNAEKEENLPPSKTSPHFTEPLAEELYPLERDENVRIECKVAGDPCPDIVWFKDGIKLEPSRRIRLEWDPHTRIASVVLKRLHILDTGEYECIVYSENGSFSSKTTLHVKALEMQKVETIDRDEPEENVPPKFFLDVKDKKVFKGASVTLDCVIKGTPVPEVKWLRHGREVFSRSGKYIITRKDQLHSLTVENFGKSDEGCYTCEATSAAGSSSSSAYLTIEVVDETDSAELGPPTISSNLEGLVVPVGGEAVFKCSAKGNPAPKFKWQKDMLDISHSHRMLINTSGGESTLTIMDVNLRDGGMYVCVAKNKLGHIKSTAKLIVNENSKQLRRMSSRNGSMDLIAQEDQNEEKKTEEQAPTDEKADKEKVQSVTGEKEETVIEGRDIKEETKSASVGKEETVNVIEETVVQETKSSTEDKGEIIKVEEEKSTKEEVKSTADGKDETIQIVEEKVIRKEIKSVSDDKEEISKIVEEKTVKEEVRSDFDGKEKLVTVTEEKTVTEEVKPVSGEKEQTLDVKEQNDQGEVKLMSDVVKGTEEKKVEEVKPAPDSQEETFNVVEEKEVKKEIEPISQEKEEAVQVVKEKEVKEELPITTAVKEEVKPVLDEEKQDLEVVEKQKDQEKTKPVSEIDEVAEKKKVQEVNASSDSQVETVKVVKEKEVKEEIENVSKEKEVQAVKEKEIKEESQKIETVEVVKEKEVKEEIENVSKEKEEEVQAVKEKEIKEESQKIETVKVVKEKEVKEEIENVSKEKEEVQAVKEKEIKEESQKISTEKEETTKSDEISSESKSLQKDTTTKDVKEVSETLAAIPKTMESANDATLIEQSTFMSVDNADIIVKQEISQENKKSMEISNENAIKTSETDLKTKEEASSVGEKIHDVSETTDSMTEEIMKESTETKANKGDMSETITVKQSTEIIMSEEDKEKHKDISDEDKVGKSDIVEITESLQSDQKLESKDITDSVKNTKVEIVEKVEVVGGSEVKTQEKVTVTKEQTANGQLQVSLRETTTETKTETKEQTANGQVQVSVTETKTETKTESSGGSIVTKTQVKREDEEFNIDDLVQQAESILGESSSKKTEVQDKSFEEILAKSVLEESVAEAAGEVEKMNKSKKKRLSKSKQRSQSLESEEASSTKGSEAEFNGSTSEVVAETSVQDKKAVKVQQGSVSFESVSEGVGMKVDVVDGNAISKTENVSMLLSGVSKSLSVQSHSAAVTERSEMDSVGELMSIQKKSVSESKVSIETDESAATKRQETRTPFHKVNRLMSVEDLKDVLDVKTLKMDETREAVVEHTISGGRTQVLEVSARRVAKLTSPEQSMITSPEFSPPMSPLHNPPEIIIPPETQLAHLHSEIEFTVKVRAAHGAVINWYHDGEKVNVTGEHYELTEDEFLEDGESTSV